MAEDRDFKGVWIPRHIWLDEKLTWSEKLLLVEIDSLDNEQGCFASNEYFAQFFGLSKDRVSKIITSLKRKGYIDTKIKYKKGSKAVEKRIIKITYTPRYAHRYPIGEITVTPRYEYLDPIGENAKDNNTVNNTKNNTVNKRTPLPPTDQLSNFENNPELKAKIEDWITYKAERRETYKPMGLKSLLTQIENKLALHSETEIINLIDSSMANGWRGIIWDRLDKPKQGNNSFMDIDF